MAAMEHCARIAHLCHPPPAAAAGPCIDVRHVARTAAAREAMPHMLSMIIVVHRRSELGSLDHDVGRHCAHQ